MSAVPTPEPRPAADDHAWLASSAAWSFDPQLRDNCRRALDEIDRLRARVTELEAVVAVERAKWCKCGHPLISHRWLDGRPCASCMWCKEFTPAGGDQ